MRLCRWSVQGAGRFCFAVNVFRVPRSAFRVSGFGFWVSGLKWFGPKSISRTPTSYVESFTGWSSSGRATSGSESSYFLTLASYLLRVALLPVPHFLEWSPHFLEFEWNHPIELFSAILPGFSEGFTSAITVFACEALTLNDPGFLTLFIVRVSLQDKRERQKTAGPGTF